jgi:hypothetical protein
LYGCWAPWRHTLLTPTPPRYFWLYFVDSEKKMFLEMFDM